MKQLNIGLLFLALSAASLSANPLCTSTTIDQYLSVAHGGTGALTICDAGSTTYNFTNTTYAPVSVLYAAQLLTKSQVLVTPISSGAFGANGLDIHAIPGQAFAIDNGSTSSTGTATYTITYSVSAPSTYFKGVVATILGGTQTSPNALAISSFNFNKTVKDTLNNPLGNPNINQNTPTEPSQTNSNFQIFSTNGFYSSILVTDQLTLSVGKAVGTTHATVSITDMENLFVVPEPGTVGTLAMGFGSFGLLLLRRRRNKA